jgi:hypothetical protein
MGSSEEDLSSLDSDIKDALDMDWERNGNLEDEEENE